MADQVLVRCQKCHQHANKVHSLSIAISILMSPWSFTQWGLDLIGKLPTAPGQYKYAIVAVDYYTKFGISETIITDNGTQFSNPNLIEFTEDIGTWMVFASVTHPKTNRIKYYNGCLFHTVQKDFTAQTGDPTETGSGGDSIYK
ncbi:PREDICTED: uncharacterized protein LOC101314359 [Fragaria vesca subsp. vesca]